MRQGTVGIGRDGKAGGMRVVVIHGAHGGPDTNWFPWLDRELAVAGMAVVRPGLPTPRGQSLEAWMAVFDRAVGPVAAVPTLLVGHSLGAAMALRVVERAAAPVAGVFLAAGFVGALGLPDYDGINASFFAAPFDRAGIRARRGRAGRCWAGEDDPYVPLERSREVAEMAGLALEVVRGGGHLNDESGFVRFPALRDAVLAARNGGG